MCRLVSRQRHRMCNCTSVHQKSMNFEFQIVLAISPLLITLFVWLLFSFRWTTARKSTTAIGLLLILFTWWSGHRMMLLEHLYIEDEYRRQTCLLLRKLAVDHDVITQKRVERALGDSAKLGQTAFWTLLSENKAQKSP